MTVGWTLHADGASRGNPGAASIGALLVGPDGARHEISETIGRTTNNVAEYRALIAGLALARELGASGVEVRMDSELVIRQVQGRYQVKTSHLVPLRAEAAELVRAVGARLAHVPRAQNADADALANRALDDARR